MSAVQLRFLAEVNPSTPEFDALAGDSLVTFMPLETVWADNRLDTSRVSRKSEVAAGYVRFRNGDVLTPKVTPTFQAGRSALVNALVNGAGAATTEVHVIRARPGLSDARFLRYRLLAKDFLDAGVANFQGVAGLQRISADFVCSLPMVPFSLEEQRRIADFLDDQVARIDALGASRRAQVSLLDEALISVVSSVVRFGPDSSVTPGRTTKLRYLAGLITGLTYAPEDICASGEGTAVLRSGNVQAGRIDRSDLVYVSSPVPLELRLQAGDILMCSRNGSARLLGKNAVIPNELAGDTFGAFMTVIRSDMNEWLYWVFQSDIFATQLGKYSTATINQLTIGMLADLDVPTPDVDRTVMATQQLVQETRAIDAAQEHLRTSIELLGEYKRSLITAAVTGELDVTTARPVVSA